jgi:hypothetical protein
MQIIQVVGGLGSQMMAYSLYIAMVKRRNQAIICDFSWFNYNRCHNGAELDRIFGIKQNMVSPGFAFFLHSRSFVAKILRRLAYLSGLLKNYSAERRNYNYDEDVFVQKGNVRYLQCWTSWKYFQGVEQEIIDLFKFPDVTDLENIRTRDLIKNSNSVSIHVRRGDALGSYLGSLVNDFYYKSAIDYICANIEDPVFFVFSDDIEWCRNNLRPRFVHYIDWNHGSSSFRDMQLMACCKHNIIPNSSFSWWAAYLNRNPGKIVIAPEKWGSAEVGVQLDDMNMPGWVLIKNSGFQVQESKLRR